MPLLAALLRRYDLLPRFSLRFGVVGYYALASQSWTPNDKILVETYLL